MGAAYFYHLTRRGLDEVLPQLLERARAQGWRVLVRGRNPRAMEQLDERLWTYAEDAFLPHGIAGGPDDSRQPILLTAGEEPPGDRDCVICVEGAGIAPGEVAGAERVCIVFDGAEPAALERARSQWRALTGAGIAAQYWSEESGNWEKKADR